MTTGKSRVSWRCKECALVMRGANLAFAHGQMKNHAAGYERVVECRTCFKEKPYVGNARFCSVKCEEADDKRVVKGEVRV